MSYQLYRRLNPLDFRAKEGLRKKLLSYFMVKLKQRITAKKTSRVIRLPFLKVRRNIAVSVGVTLLFVFFSYSWQSSGETIHQRKEIKTLQVRGEFDNFF